MAARRTPDEARKEDEKQPGFEEAMKRLEAIVAEMEKGTLGLDEMISRFEEGQALVAYCNKKLNEVERKIEILRKKENGELATEDFDPSGIQEESPS
ncbi:MAG: exodeoxyribonuclease VII small subunit [Kiritimatiellae bacterium]|nr:exodeoxyribonuclease VII small subunit [Kiritimatiellia bacterium]